MSLHVRKSEQINNSVFSNPQKELLSSPPSTLSVLKRIPKGTDSHEAWQRGQCVLTEIRIFGHSTQDDLDESLLVERTMNMVDSLTNLVMVSVYKIFRTT